MRSGNGKDKKLAIIGSKGNYVTKPASIMRFTSKAERELVSFHAKNPESSGIPKEVLRQTIAEKMDKECFDVMLQEAQRTGKIVQSQGEVSHVEAGAGVKALEREAAAKLFCLASVLVVLTMGRESNCIRSSATIFDKLF